MFGLLSAEQSHHDLFTLGGAGWWTRLRKLELPGALPAMFAGFQISAGLAVIGAVVGDFFFSRGRTGIGRLIVDFFTNNAGGLMVICAGLTALDGHRLLRRLRPPQQAGHRSLAHHGARRHRVEPR